MLRRRLAHHFRNDIPASIDDGILYISIDHAVAVHRCCCGCGEKVVTPFTPTDWSIIFDGETVSLSPSIGNWGFACRSHYVIKRNKIIWMTTWNQARIDAERMRDRAAKQRHFELRHHDS